MHKLTKSFKWLCIFFIQTIVLFFINSCVQLLNRSHNSLLMISIIMESIFFFNSQERLKRRNLFDIFSNVFTLDNRGAIISIWNADFDITIFSDNNHIAMIKIYYWILIITLCDALFHVLPLRISIIYYWRSGVKNTSKLIQIVQFK